MKKSFTISIQWISFVLLLCSNTLFSQYFEVQKDLFLKNYETDYSKGKIDVNIPLFNIPTAKKSLQLNIGLSYYTDYVSGHSSREEVGLGWSLINGGGAISKYTQIGLNDNGHIYQYNFLGKTGRFYVRYDNSVGDLRAVESYPSTNKIVIMKTNDTIFTGFKIIDGNGFKFIFDKKNISYRYEYPHITTAPGHPGSNPLPKKFLFTSAFLLSKILDEKDNVVADYEFLTRSLSIDTNKSIIENTVNKITIPNIGTVDYLYPGATSSLNSSLLLNKIVVKNKSNQIINQYTFYVSSGVLQEVIQKDKNNVDVNKYQFTYHYPVPLSWSNEPKLDMYGFVNAFVPCYMDYENFYQVKSINPDQFNYGFLKSIIYPTGGKTEYEYEANTLSITPYNYNTVLSDFGPELADFEVDKLADIDFDKLNTNAYPFTIQNVGNYSRFLIKESHDFHDQTNSAHPNYNFSYKLQKSSVSTDTLTLKKYKYTYEQECDYVKEFNPAANSNLIFKLYGGPTFGKAQVWGVKKQSRNYRYAKGGRIKSVKTYEKDAVSPTSVTKFDYNLFSNPSKSSAVLYSDFEDYYEPILPAVGKDGDAIKNDREMVLYENVKITDSIKNTSVKLTYLMPKEIDSLYGENNGSYMTIDFNHSIKRMGLVKKVEKFDSGNNLVEKMENIYNIEYVAYNGITDTFNNPLKVLFNNSIISNNQVAVNGSNMLYSSQQKFFEPQNSLLTKEITTDFSGTVSQSNIYYPKDVSNQKLLDANIIGVPLKLEATQDGNLVGKTETKFDDPATVYPTSQITYNMQTQGAQTAGSIESYDDVGNVREIKSKNGTSTVTIWGYYKTQPIAVIVGPTFAQIQNLSVITAAINASNQDNDNPANELALIQALDNLRKDNALKGYQITTYTYDPLIGVTSTTSPTGVRQVNIYDSANRLLKVMDMNGKTLKEFKYNYKNQ